MPEEQVEKSIAARIDDIREIQESTENRRRWSNWERVAGLPGIFTRYIPHDDLISTPVIVDLDREMWAHVLGFDLTKVYSKPLSYLEFELSKKVYAYEHFQDDMPLSKNITMWFGVGFVESLLGLEQTPAGPTQEPWVGKGPLINEKSELRKIPLSSMKCTAAAQRAISFSSEIKDMLGEDFTLVFPEWDFGPFGTAMHIRGMENLSLDFFEDPPFVHDLFSFLTQVKKNWSHERSTFLQEPIHTLYLANDDINVPFISPRVYEEFVFPQEKEWGLFHGGIDYWHSCGRIDPVLHLIKELPGLRMVHISPWTDLKKAVEILSGTGIILEVVMNPIDDVLAASSQEIQDKLKHVRDLCAHVPFILRADAFQVYSKPEQDLEKIRLWIKAARSVL